MSESIYKTKVRDKVFTKPLISTHSFGWRRLSLCIFLVIALVLSHQYPVAAASFLRLNYEPNEKELGYIYKTRTYVSDRLRDGDSAEFRNVFVGYKHKGIPVVCGQVNSKNAFGGYSGWQSFIAAPTGDLVILEEMMAPGEMRSAWSQACE